MALKMAQLSMLINISYDLKKIIKKPMPDLLKNKITLNMGITLPSLVFIIITCFFAALFPEKTGAVLDEI